MISFKFEKIATEPELLSNSMSAVMPPVDRKNEEPDIVDVTAVAVEEEKSRELTSLESINTHGSSQNNTTLSECKAAMVVTPSRSAEIGHREEKERSCECVVLSSNTGTSAMSATTP